MSMIEITLPIMLQILQTAGILVGIIYYITVMRNQNASRQIQIIRGVASRDPPNWRWISIEWDDFEDFRSKYVDTESEHWDNALLWFNNYEELGVYVREGLLDVRLVCLLNGGTFTKSWERFEPILLEYRRRLDHPRYFIEAEYLYRKVKEYMNAHKDEFYP